MNTRSIEKEIEKREGEIATWEAERNALDLKIREAKGFVEGMKKAVQLLPRDAGLASAGKSSGSLFRGDSDPAKTRRLILEAGKPLHISEILAGLGKEDSRPNQISVSGSLSAYVRKGEVFTRPAPRTFGLMELNHHDDALTDGENASLEELKSDGQEK